MRHKNILRNNVIIIRVNNREKKLAEKYSKAEGKNVSEFFRKLLYDSDKKRFTAELIEITDKHRNILEDYGKILDRFKQQAGTE